MTFIKNDAVGEVLKMVTVGIRAEELLVVAAFVAAIVVGVIFQKAQAQALRRLRAAAEAYADLELARDRQIPTREFSALAFPTR